MRYFINFLIQAIRWLPTLLVYCTPIFGIWLVSSLVAYINGPIWLSLLSAILLFPLLPLTWELRAMRRRRQKGMRTPRILTFGDRLTLRTLALNLAFIACLLTLLPQTAFLALNTRGDWMLENQRGPQVEIVRQILFKTANLLEGLYLVVRKNPYDQYATQTKGTANKPQPNTKNPSPQPSPAKQNASNWPWEGSTLHPAVANMPASVEVSIESVARYIAEKESDPFLRVKALHDYVADRVAYDAAAYFGQIPRPPQDPETVFKTRKAVCVGYATLLEALGKAINEEIVIVTGDARTQLSDLSGESHAWNAAKIQGDWYLIDATWDSGYTDKTGFSKNYRTDYLFPPPQVLVVTHFPSDPAWQLLSAPLERGKFLRQPMLRPSFFAQELKLISPTRSQTDVRTTAIIEVENPRQRWLMASFAKKGEQQFARCAEQTSQEGQLSCPLPNAGTYELNLYSSPEQSGKYASYIGQLEFNRR